MAWYDVANIPWLNTNPQEFSLKSEQAAQGIGANFAAGMRAGIEGAKQRALLPLEQRLLEDKQKLSALELQTELSKRADSISAKAAFAKMATAAADISNRAAWADPKSEAQIWSIASEHPAVVNTPEFRNITSQFDIAGKAVLAVKDAETRALSAADRAAAATERNLLLKDQIAFKDLQHQEDVKSREDINAANIASREKIATELNASNKERDLFKVENRIDPKTGKFVSEMEFVNRHLKGFMDTGIKEDEAVKRIKAVYKDLVPISGSAPAALSGSAPVIQTKSEYDKLPNGTRYIRNGVEYIKGK